MTYATTRLNHGTRAWPALGLLAAALVSGHAARADDGDLRRQIIGSWGQDASCNSGRITFREDGTVSMVETRASGPTSMEGRYAIGDGSITLTDSTGKTLDTSPIQITGSEMAVRSENGRNRTVVRCSNAAGPSR